MSDSISLLLGVHAHQPVGNFVEVIDDAMERCYRPFLKTLSRYPEFRFSVHISGWLLEEMFERHPADMDLLAAMAARGQVEFFGAGDCEPVLAAIATRDRVSQIDALSDRLERRFGQRPRGAWLTERVWEATVVPALADCGIRYVVVDDYHFLCAGKRAEELDGYYSTEEDGRQLAAYPISEALRYRLPFSPAAEAVAFLEQLAAQGHSAAVYFDDIEKFGIWPETYEWVYEKGWLERFIEGVLASPRIRTETYAQFHARHPTRGVVYLPTTSYIEMNEWTLPPAAAHEYHRLVEQEKAAGHYERSKANVRGGIWRNFFTRYPESNWMHKRMLGLSRRLAEIPATDPHVADMRVLLHRAQANDAYWHGLFGGLYLPHLRRAVWANLIELEQALDGHLPRSPLAREDVDLDGCEELMLHNAHLQIAVRADGNAAVHELDAFALRQNFCDTLARRREHYFARIEGPTARHHGDGIASAHERVDFKHEIHSADLLADAQPRASFLDCWIDEPGRAHHLGGYALTQTSAPLHALTFSTEIPGGRIEKRLTLEGARLIVSYRVTGTPTGRLVTRLNLSMPSCDGYAGRYVREDGSIPCGFGQSLEIAQARRLTLEDGVLGGSIAMSASAPVALSAAPYHTVSLSEAGFEKIMQAAVLTLSWPLDAAHREVAVELAIGGTA